MDGTILEMRRGDAHAIAFTAYACGIIASSHALGWSAAVCAIAIVASCAAAPKSWTARRALMELAVVVNAAGVIGYCLGSRASWVRLLPPFATLNEHHVAVVAAALERAKPASSGLSLRICIRTVSAPRTADAAALAGQVRSSRDAVDFTERAPRRPDAARSRPCRIARRRSQRRRSGAARYPCRTRRCACIGRPSRARCRGGGPAPGVEAWMARLRARFADVIESRLPALDATVLDGVAWGDRSDLPAALRQEFSDTGTVHVLTTAALHLGIMAALIARLLGALPLLRAVRTIAVIGAAWLYAAPAGLHLPTIPAYRSSLTERLSIRPRPYASGKK